MNQELTLTEVLRGTSLLHGGHSRQDTYDIIMARTTVFKFLGLYFGLPTMGDYYDMALRYQCVLAVLCILYTVWTDLLLPTHYSNCMHSL